MVDSSITRIQIRCFSTLLRFFGREMKCPDFTNAKAFSISALGTYASSVILDKELFLFIPRPVINTAFWLSFGAMSFEMSGLIIRIVNHYFYYFTHFYNGPRLTLYSRPATKMISLTSTSTSSSSSTSSSDENNF